LGPNPPGTPVRRASGERELAEISGGGKIFFRFFCPHAAGAWVPSPRPHYLGGGAFSPPPPKGGGGGGPGDRTRLGAAPPAGCGNEKKAAGPPLLLLKNSREGGGGGTPPRPGGHACLFSAPPRAPGNGVAGRPGFLGLFFFINRDAGGDVLWWVYVSKGGSFSRLAGGGTPPGGAAGGRLLGRIGGCTGGGKGFSAAPEKGGGFREPTHGGGGGGGGGGGAQGFPGARRFLGKRGLCARGAPPGWKKTVGLLGQPPGGGHGIGGGPPGGIFGPGGAAGMARENKKKTGWGPPLSRGDPGGRPEGSPKGSAEKGPGPKKDPPRRFRGRPHQASLLRGAGPTVGGGKPRKAPRPPAGGGPARGGPNFFCNGVVYLASPARLGANKGGGGPGKKPFRRKKKRGAFPEPRGGLPARLGLFFPAFPLFFCSGGTKKKRISRHREKKEKTGLRARGKAGGGGNRGGGGAVGKNLLSGPPRRGAQTRLLFFFCREKNRFLKGGGGNAKGRGAHAGATRFFAPQKIFSSFFSFPPRGLGFV